MSYVYEIPALFIVACEEQHVHSLFVVIKKYLLVS